MNLSRTEMSNRFEEWLKAWNDYNLDGVKKFIHDEIIFDNWNGRIISGKINLEESWATWFAHHGNFKFTKDDISIDEEEQKMTFSWELKWPSFEKKFAGKPEKRRGVDILYLKEGKIYKKNTYSKTVIDIDGKKVLLNAV